MFNNNSRGKITKIATLAGVTSIAVGIAGLVVGCVPSNQEEDDIRIALILDEGGVNDQSFNESAWEGALKAKENHDVDVMYFEAKQESDYTTNVENAIDQDCDLIIGVGFKLTETIQEASQNYPDQNFALIDGTYDEIPENVLSILFNEKQAGYCAGLVANMMSESRVVSFVGGMDIPSCSNFLVGFKEALKDEGSDIKVLSQYANSFTDASKGRAIAEQMVNKGADIIFTAGGGVNSGVFEVCREKGIKAIGVDMPSNYISPDTIITSALKNVGVGVESTIEEVVEGKFEGGKEKVYDLSNGGVGYEITNLLPQDVIDYVNERISKK